MEWDKNYSDEIKENGQQAYYFYGQAQTERYAAIKEWNKLGEDEKEIWFALSELFSELYR